MRAAGAWRRGPLPARSSRRETSSHSSSQTATRNQASRMRLSARLDQLHQALEAGQQHQLDEALLAAGAGQVRTAKDTAIFGSDREVLVYNRRGLLGHRHSSAFDG